MKHPAKLYALLGLIACAGCHYRDPSIDILENEARRLEDQVYALQDELALKCAQLSACQQAECQSAECFWETTPAAPIQTYGEGAVVTPDVREPSTEPGYDVVPSEPRRSTTAPRQDSGDEVEESESSPPVIEMPSAGDEPPYDSLDESDTDSDEVSIERPPYEVMSEDPSVPESSPKNRKTGARAYEVLPDQLPTPAGSSPSPAGEGSNEEPETELMPTLASPAVESDGQFFDGESPPDLLLPPEADATDPDHELPTPGVRPRIEGQSEGPSYAENPAVALASHAEGSLENGGNRSKVAHDEETEISTEVDARITHVVVRSWLTDGTGFFDKARDADLMVLVEPRNADGQVVRLGGPVSIVVLDGDQTGPSARIGRWDYSAAETRRVFRKTPWGYAMLFELQWPLEPPTTKNLHVFVRYATIEDKQLECEQQIEPVAPDKTVAKEVSWRKSTSKQRRKSAGTAKSDLVPTTPGIELQPIPKDDSLSSSLPDTDQGP
jgi:hypothetical protein